MFLKKEKTPRVPPRRDKAARSSGSRITASLEGLSIPTMCDDCDSDTSEQRMSDTVKPGTTRFNAEVVKLPASPSQNILILPAGDGAWVVFMAGAFGYWDDGEYTGAVMDLIQLLVHATPEESFTFYMSGPGGSLEVGTAIVAAMKATLAKTTTVAMGPCCSCMALLWTYGQRKVVSEAGSIMVHMSSHGDFGNSHAIGRQAMASVRHIQNIALDPLLKDGLITQDEYDQVVDKDTDLWISPDTMRERLAALDVEGNES